MAKSGTVDVLADDEVASLDLADLVDSQNIRVVKRRGRPGFHLKPVEHFRLSDEVGREEFQRNVSAELSIPCPAYV